MYVYVCVGRRDNKEWNFYWEHPFPRIIGYKRSLGLLRVKGSFLETTLRIYVGWTRIYHYFECFCHTLYRLANLWNQRANYDVCVWRRDNKEWNFYWEHPFHRVLEYKRSRDIKEVDNTDYRGYRCARGLGLGKLHLVTEPEAAQWGVVYMPSPHVVFPHCLSSTQPQRLFKCGR